MPEIGLGIGRQVGTYEGWTPEWLYWYDQEAISYPTPEEVAQAERQRANRAQQQLESLKAALLQRGISPDTL